VGSLCTQRDLESGEHFTKLVSASQMLKLFMERLDFAPRSLALWQQFQWALQLAQDHVALSLAPSSHVTIPVCVSVCPYVFCVYLSVSVCLGVSVCLCV
jgi:hypothetical protein